MEPISMGVCLDVGMIVLDNGSVVFIESGIQWVRSVISAPMPMLKIIHTLLMHRVLVHF